MPDPDRPVVAPVPLTRTWLFRGGTRCWLAIGVLLIIVLVLWILGTLSSVVVPLTIASLVAIVVVPVVDRLQRWRVGRAAGSALVLAAIVAVTIWSAWLTVAAVADQGPQIANALTRAFTSLDEWLARLDSDLGIGSDTAAGLQESLRDALGGVAASLSGAVGGVLTDVWALVIGSVFAGFFLYYLLSDWHGIVRWAGSQVGSGGVPGDELVAAAVDAVRRYFIGLTLSALVTAVVIGGTALLLDIPLWLTVAVVTFVTSYVPYLGAVVSGAFATLIALGTQGGDAAIVMLVVVLVVQNVLQTVILTNLTSGQLHIHPIANLASTLIGGSLAGILGATLAAPLLATTIRIRRLVAGSRTALLPTEDRNAEGRTGGTTRRPFAGRTR